MNKKQIAIIGPGGVGGYFGFKINEANNREKYLTTFVARGETYEILNTKGLTLLSPEHSTPTTKPDKVVKKHN